MKLFFKYSSLFLVLVSSFCYSQQAVVTSGSDYSSSFGSISYTVGQIDFNIYTAGSGTINMGVQQPAEIFIVSAPESQQNEDEFTISPNPSNNLVLISRLCNISNNAYCVIYNSQGQIVVKESNLGLKNEIPIDFLSAGVYYLCIYNSFQLVQQFKLIKV